MIRWTPTGSSRRTGVKIRLLTNFHTSLNSLGSAKSSSVIKGCARVSLHCVGLSFVIWWTLFCLCIFWVRDLLKEKCLLRCALERYLWLLFGGLLVMDEWLGMVGWLDFIDCSLLTVTANRHGVSYECDLIICVLTGYGLREWPGDQYQVSINKSVIITFDLNITIFITFNRPSL